VVPGSLAQVRDRAGEVIDGRYRLRRPIGAGGSATVYVAEDIRLGSRVAVKVLHPALAEDALFVRRFREEGRTVRRLEHAHVVHVYDWGDDPFPYLVLELLPGGSLLGLLDHGHVLDVAQAAVMGRDIAKALAFAHSLGVIHRDLKPANLLFDAHGSVKVADFGLASALADARWTEPGGTVLGTARYASPELAAGAPVVPASDQYALALVLVEAVTGEPAFHGESPLGILAARPRQAVEVDVETFGPLTVVIEQAGRIDPAERFPDAGALARALEDVVRSLPPAAPLPVHDGAVDETDLAGRDPTQLAAGVDPAWSRRARPRPPAARPGAAATGATVRAPSTRTTLVDVPDDALAPEVAPVRARPPVRGGPVAPAPTPASVIAGRVVTAVMALLVVGALGVAAYAWAQTPAHEVAVPNLVGTTEVDAAAAATQAGFDLERAGDVVGPEPPGTVLGQDPPAGSLVDDDDRGVVRITVSAGPGTVMVPAVAGTADEARSALEAAGFLVGGVTEVNDEAVAAGQVVRSEPPAGSPVAPGSTISLVASSGPSPRVVPNLVGLPREQADAALAAVQLVGEVAEEVFDNTGAVPAGVVMSQETPADEQVARDTTIRYVVSKGQDLVAVPNVIGFSRDEAEEDLEALGFAIDIEEYRPDRTVVSVSPAPGQRVLRGTTVVVTFGGDDDGG
jgi:eukaryotic-like serine/threonine-protein kinase